MKNKSLFHLLKEKGILKKMEEDYSMHLKGEYKNTVPVYDINTTSRTGHTRERQANEIAPVRSPMFTKTLQYIIPLNTTEDAFRHVNYELVSRVTLQNVQLYGTGVPAVPDDTLAFLKIDGIGNINSFSSSLAPSMDNVGLSGMIAFFTGQYLANPIVLVHYQNANGRLQGGLRMAVYGSNGQRLLVTGVVTLLIECAIYQ